MSCVSHEASDYARPLRDGMRSSVLIGSCFFGEYANSKSMKNCEKKPDAHPVEIKIAAR